MKNRAFQEYVCIQNHASYLLLKMHNIVINLKQFFFFIYNEEKYNIFFKINIVQNFDKT
jgi:hypothetical protein